MAPSSNANIKMRRETKFQETFDRHGRTPKEVMFNNKSNDPAVDIKKVQAALGEIDKNYGFELVNKSISNTEVCNK